MGLEMKIWKACASGIKNCECGSIFQLLRSIQSYWHFVVVEDFRSVYYCGYEPVAGAALASHIDIDEDLYYMSLDSLDYRRVLNCDLCGYWEESGETSIVKLEFESWT